MQLLKSDCVSTGIPALIATLATKLASNANVPVALM